MFGLTGFYHRYFAHRAYKIPLVSVCPCPRVERPFNVEHYGGHPTIVTIIATVIQKKISIAPSKQDSFTAIWVGS